MLEFLKKEDNRKKILFILALAFTIVRVLIALGTPLWARGKAVYDDRLMLEYAVSIAEGNWLGEFGKRTLLKRPVFALFMALCFKLNIPYMLGTMLLYIAGILFFMKAINKFLKSDLSKFVFYMFMLYSPVMFNYCYTQRVYRASIIPAVVLFVVGSLGGLYIRRFESMKTVILWSLSSGISFGLFWNIREDSIWLLPFFIASLFFLFVSIMISYWKKWKELLKRLVIVIIPIVLYMGNIEGIKAINNVYYGEAVTNDMSEGAFNRMFSTLYSIKQDEEKENVSLNRATIERLYEYSPSLKSLEEYIDKVYKSGWEKKGLYKGDGEIESGYIRWAFRNAVDGAGYYENSDKVVTLYNNITDEIQTAIDSGELETKKSGLPFLSSLARPWKSYYPKLLVKRVAESFDWVIGYKKIESRALYAEGTDEQIDAFETYTQATVINPLVDECTLAGWAFAKNPEDKIELVIKYNGGSEIIKRNIKSDKVYSHFKSKGFDYEDAKVCNFKYESKKRITGNGVAINLDSPVVTESKLNRMLEVYINDELAGSYKVAELSNNTINTDAYYLKLNTVENNIKNDTMNLDSLRTVRISNLVISVYKYTGYIVFVLGTLAYLIITVLFVADLRKKSYNYCGIWLIITGSFLSAFVNIVGVSYNYIEAHNRGYRNVYMGAAYPLLHIFCLISIFVLINRVKESQKIKKLFAKN